MFERHYPALLSLLSVELRDPELAQDIAQEAYARVLAFAGRREAVREPHALLYRTARNLVVDHFRRGSLRNHAGFDECRDVAAASAEQPEDVLARRQRIERLMAAVDALPPRCQEVFVLHKFEELSHVEIAARLGISVSMVEKHMIRALLLCRRKLHPDGAAA